VAHDADVLSDRIHLLEEFLGDVGSDHYHRAPLSYIDIRDRSPAGEDIVLHDLVRRGYSEDDDITQSLVAPEHIRGWCWPAGLQADRHSLRNCRRNGLGVCLRYSRTLLDTAPLFVVEESDLDR
jgi:hypothetical protein